jgi:ABC-type spermidine/putrescine transport system permease subunit I
MFRVKRPRANSLAPWLLAAPAAGLLVLFFIVPLVILVRVSLFEGGAGEGFYRPGTWSARAYSDLLGERFGRGIIFFTVLLGIGVAGLAVVIAYPLALYIQSLRRGTRLIALGIVLLPRLINVTYVLYGLNLLLVNGGPG